MLCQLAYCLIMFRRHSPKFGSKMLHWHKNVEVENPLLFLVGWLLGPAVLHGKSLYVEHQAQTCEQNLFIPAMLVGIIDFYHFIPLSVTLTLTGDHKTKESKTSWLHFLPDFSTNQDEF